MNEWPDDRLDELFRISAEEHNPSFEPADWDNLRERLDAGTKPATSGWLRKWWPWGAVVLLLLVGGGLGFYYWGGTSVDSKEKLATTPSNPAEAVPTGGDKAGKEMNTEEVHQKPEDVRNAMHDTKGGEPKIPEEARGTPGKEKATSRKILPRSQPDAGGVRLRSSLAGRKEGDGAPHWNRKETVAGATPPASGPSLPVRSREVVRKETGTVAGTFREGVVEAAPAEQVTAVHANALLPRQTFRMTTPLSLPSISYTDSGQVAEPSVVRPASAPKLAVRLGVSPDMSSVGLTGFTNPGPATSLLIEYAVMDRLYVQSGVIRSLKAYRALPGQYEWPAYWTQYIKPISIDGDCKVLEVPLNLRYDLARSTRATWFAGAGVSSYHMQKEVYKYNYERPDPSIKRWRWEGQTGWYWLSHLNASAGYEYRFSNRLSLLAEPYVRVPLRRVGYGKVNLFTAGVWMSVRYVPAFKK
ncbi:hypothetical protein [Telluribacter sp. SYSU D00476]|uniref:hypothetical protein n=1 Tax=Telluribacter sp. SYSU D00476 TaxID=2811430 RepID=UPI001FF6F459|nr:hypothetical protein [Telluribacter sp. SYSU D00476]